MRPTIRFWGPCRRERERIANLKRLARDLIDAVKANELQVSSNDLGNAMDALEDALR